MNDDLAHLQLAAAISGVTPRELVLPESRHLVVDGMRLHYLDWGRHDRPPVVFLHGGALTAHTWDLVCLALRDRYRCVAPDLRGHGDSEWSPQLDYSLDANLRDLEGLIEELDLKCAVLVGQSMGAVVAMQYATLHPDSRASLVLVDIGPGVRLGRGVTRVADFTLGPAVFESIDEVVQRALAFNPRRDERLLRRSVQQNLRKLPDGRWTWKYDRRHLSRERFSDLAVEYGSVLARDAAYVRCPVLIVRGSESDALSEEDASMFAELFGNARWVTVPRAGHNVQGDNPAGLLTELWPFIEDATRRERSWR